MPLHSRAPLVPAGRTLIVLTAACIAGCATAVRSSSTGAVDTGDMARIPGGTFVMGTDSSEVPALLARYALTSPRILADEVPRRPATVAPFLLDRTEVTQGDFRAFVLANPAWRREARPAGSHTGRYLEGWNGAEHPAGHAHRPAAFITWPAAAAYCAWRGRRLPSEAEWEWAARGGLDDPEFPWGSAPPDTTRANWSASRTGHPVDVGRFPPNGYGLHDMAGNVWEFTADRWSTADAGPPDPATRYVIRGGSYGAAPVNLRVRWRDSHPAGNAGDHVGFRCAR